jgi:hypothetical protein
MQRIAKLLIAGLGLRNASERTILLSIAGMITLTSVAFGQPTYPLKLLPPGICAWE